MRQGPDPQIAALIDSGECAAALQLAQQALQTSEAAARGELLLQVSAAHGALGQWLDAMRAAVAAEACFSQCGAAGGVCDALNRIGQTFRAVGDHASAIDSLERAESIARELADPVRTSAVLRSLGICSSIIGRHQHALSCVGEAADLARQHGSLLDQLNTRLSYHNARNRQAVSEPAAAATTAQVQERLAPWRQLAADCADGGFARLELMALGNLGITMQDCGQTEAARVVLDGLLARYRSLNMWPNLAICHNALGRCHECLSQPATAREHYLQAVELLRDSGSLDDLQEAQERLSHVEEAVGDLAAALAALRQARRIDKRKSDAAARDAVVQRELRIELFSLSSQWARLAREDPLTGLANRRGLEQWFREHPIDGEGVEPVALILMDLDHFKQVNDTHGHDTGDRVLQRVAAVVREHCRARDLAVRYGGEEFLLALASVDRDEALEIAERLCAVVAAHDWQQVRPGLTVTVSAGVTAANEAADVAGLLALADRRLYAAKIGGRNQVVAA